MRIKAIKLTWPRAFKSVTSCRNEGITPPTWRGRGSPLESTRTSRREPPEAPPAPRLNARSPPQLPGNLGGPRGTRTPDPRVKSPIRPLSAHVPACLQTSTGRRVSSDPSVHRCPPKSTDFHPRGYTGATSPIGVIGLVSGDVRWCRRKRAGPASPRGSLELPIRGHVHAVNHLRSQEATV